MCVDVVSSTKHNPFLIVYYLAACLTSSVRRHQAIVQEQEGTQFFLKKVLGVLQLTVPFYTVHTYCN
jgi:high-affinity K+ transport system ATPase subunit B